MLTIGSFLLTMGFFYLQLTNLVFLLTVGVFFTYTFGFLLTLGVFCLQCENASKKRLKGL